VLSCPVCAADLEQHEKKLVCANQHSFDRARQGYYNLLLNQHKNSKAPGDNADMVAARTAFLDSGAYQSISDTINQFAVDQLWEVPNSQLVDMGCGEGYYTHRLQQALADHQISSAVYGLDISKDAIKVAAKRNKDVTWLVANANKPPFVEGGAHFILNVFNRLMPDSLARMCHPDGRLLVVSAGSHHLQQLKEAIYETPRYKEFDCQAALADHFNHSHRTTLNFTMHLNQTQIHALLAMTPHVWRSSPQTQAGLKALDALDLKVHVNLDLFVKK